MDILIYAKPEIVTHKVRGRSKDNNFYCFWTNRTPAEQNLGSIERVYFSNGKRIFAEAKFLLALTRLEKRLCFSPLRIVNKKQPKKPPTRGWCYINKGD